MDLINIVGDIVFFVLLPVLYLYVIRYAWNDIKGDD